MQNTEDIRAKFDEYFGHTIYPLLVEKENVRQKYLSRFKKLIAMASVILPLVIALAYYIVKKYDEAGEWAVNVTYLIIAISAFILRGPFASYKKQSKTDIMECFIKFFDNFSYEPEDGLSYFDIKESYIFPKFDVLQTDDCFVGTYKDVGIRICEEKLIKKSVDSNGRTRNKVVFLGMVLVLEMNKNFNYRTFVVKDKGILNMFHGKKGFSKVALEDVIFEKEFEAYSQNQIEARYLLTTAFMERMLKLKELYKGKRIQFGFEDSAVLIAIDTKENMFEPCSLLKSNLKKDQIYKVYEQFMTIFSVVDTLKLNQKIGM